MPRLSSTLLLTTQCHVRNFYKPFLFLKDKSLYQFSIHYSLVKGSSLRRKLTLHLLLLYFCHSEKQNAHIFLSLIREGGRISWEEWMSPLLLQNPSLHPNNKNENRFHLRFLHIRSYPYILVSGSSSSSSLERSVGMSS